MTRHNPIRSDLIPQQGRIAIVAGSGVLPAMVAEALRSAGHEPLVVMIEGEADPELSKYDHCTYPLEHLGGLVTDLKRRNAVALVMAGGVSRRPRLRDVKLTANLLRDLPRLATMLLKGDDGALRMIISHFEKMGIRVVGAHEFLPDMVIGEGAITKKKPTRRDQPNLDMALKAARLLGACDVGQGAVAVGGRVVALEGAEGTASMLARVAELRKSRRIPPTKPGVLVKCSKPGQELRADMPAIGPDTIGQIEAAGLAGIAVEQDRTLVLDYERTVALADEAGLFIVGVAAEPEP